MRAARFHAVGVLILAVLTLPASISGQARKPAATGPEARAIVGGTVVDGTGGPPLRDAMVLIRDGKIACVGARGTCPLPAGAEVIDVTGLWLTPGLIDAHVHFSQTGWADGRPDALDLRERYPYEQVEAELRYHPERFFASYLCSGVTGVFDVGGYPWTWDLRKRAENDVWAPHVAAAGPLLSTRDHWLNLPAERQFIYLADAKAAREGVGYLAAFGTDAVKVWFIMEKNRPFEEMAAAVHAAGEEARRLKLPLIVHATGLKEAKEALRAGAHILVHSVIDLPVDVEFLDLAKQNGTIYCPTLTVFAGYVRMFDAVLAGKAPFLDDPNHCVDATTRVRIAEAALVGADKVDKEKAEARRNAVASQEKVAAANLKTVTDAGLTVAMGTDAGNPMTLHGPSVYAEMEAMQAAGMTPMQVLVASTRNGAHAMGRLSDFGTIEKGKIADLLVLAADPTASAANFCKVRYVVRAGVVHPIAELRTIH
jgi:imidazolonepropionase-like amidohydrolase